VTNNFCALCADLIEAVLSDDSHIDCTEIARRARAALADGPAVPQDREPASVTGRPSDEELLDLLPQGNESGFWLPKGLPSDWVDGEFIAPPKAIIAFARDVLELWGNPTPPPPADGEVAELVAWLRETGDTIQPSHLAEHQRYKRAAELLQRQALVPVAASERLPEPSTKVLAHYVNDLGKGRTICAIWVPAKTRIDEGGHDDFTEYDEEDDKFYWPEGWYEAIENWDELGYVKVYEGEVDYWQPLPKRPAHALSLAEVDE
jgi:hypothetical protein